MSDRYWMQQAYQQALKAKSLNEIPVGAVLISADQTLLGAGFNCMISQTDPTAHAEIIALRKAALTLNNYRLKQATLYVTLEPCPMCAAALVQARIKRLVFATRDFKTGACGSRFNLLKGSPLNHRIRIDEGILESDCSTLLQDFFSQCRA